MRMFREVLKRTSERLDLPQPLKSRIMLEIGADLKDIYEECIGRGMSPEDAQSRAVEMCDLSDEALQDLIRVHETLFKRLLGGLSEQARSRWEKALLLALILFIAAFSGRELLTRELFTRASIFVWPIAAAAFYALITALVNVYRLYIRKVYDPRRFRSGPAGILAAGGMCLMIGSAGLAVDFYRAAMAIAADQTGALAVIVEWGLSSSAMMMAAILAAISAAIVWFALDSRMRAIEAAETAWLFETY